jgi:hypothetical protein
VDEADHDVDDLFGRDERRLAGSLRGAPEPPPVTIAAAPSISTAETLRAATDGRCWHGMLGILAR